jgi:hypothetical protein
VQAVWKREHAAAETAEQLAARPIEFEDRSSIEPSHELAPRRS